MIELDAPSDIPGMTVRQKLDWEARHKKHCLNFHRQPCNCSPWEKKKGA